MTPINVALPTNPQPLGIFEVRPLSEESAAKTAELVKKNNDLYHIYIHDAGVHNHILHHLLALYSMGATPEQLEGAFLRGALSQNPAAKPNSHQIENFKDPARFMACMGKGKYWNDYCTFFASEVGRHGVANTVHEFMFKGDEKAEEMFRRFFGGFLHSPIHLGYAIEFDQPLIVAEALAMTAVHDTTYGEVLHMIEREAPPSSSRGRSLIEIHEALAANNNIRNALDYGNFGMFQQSIIPKAKDDFVNLVSQWRVQPDELHIKASEILNTFTYLTALAQRPDKQIRFDFFLMHTITASSFAPVLANTAWIAPPVRARILEWLGRAALMIYIEAGLPRPRPEELSAYQPLQPSGWESLYGRACEYEDDGHLIKLIRGIRTAAGLTEPYADRAEFPLKREEEFLTIAHMALDGAEKFHKETVDMEVDQVTEHSVFSQLLPRDVQRIVARWPRHVGFAEAWYHVPAREVAGSKARF